MYNLDKCPFCGEVKEIYLNQRTCRPRYGGYLVYVACELCGAQTKPFYSDDDAEERDWSNVACRKAVNAWNRRVGGNG